MHAQLKPAPSLTPELTIGDREAAWWLSQVSLRLRREICWHWHQHGQSGPGGGVLPPPVDRALESLDFTRYQADKQQFFATDETARYLSERIGAPQPPRPHPPRRGSRAWVAQALDLDPAAQFVLALGLAARVDAALGPVCAAAQNDLGRPYPTLALAQRLWDDPLAVGACADPAHPLFRHGLLASAPDGEFGWHQPLEMPAPVAYTILDPRGPLPAALEPVDDRSAPPPVDAGVAFARLKAMPPQAMQIVPLPGPHGADFVATAAACSQHSGRKLARLDDDFPAEAARLAPAATVCWLRGLDVLLPEDWLERTGEHDRQPWFAAVRALPLRWFLPAADISRCRSLPASVLMPALPVAGLGFHERVAALHRALGRKTAGLEGAIEEVARRFRFQQKTLDRVAATLSATDSPVTAASLFAACRDEASGRLGQLAQPAEPRFSLDELVLPPDQAGQVADIARAMNALTTVHYRWGTAKVWNESGLSVMFCGAPGTGKTMAAEALARELELPMYRIDLSQVVNKYIGETEKNLKQLFDAAEETDCILFFDEADALFGKRTDVKDAHDRFANIEISYLLERMERFRGLAILATNRRKDLDEAFLRRLRYVVEFPMPGEPERERIWRQVFPAGVDISGLNFRYLAEQFEFSGGHIRSAAFNACLQRAADDPAAAPKIEMADVLPAVQRELEKMNRTAHSELFGHYAHLLRSGT